LVQAADSLAHVGSDPEALVKWFAASLELERST
jgi:hypothetical protein